MYWFVIRKFFLDVWDNLMTVILFNFFFIVSLSIAFVIPMFFQPPAGINAIFVGVGLAATLLLVGISARYAKGIADYERADKRKFFSYLADTWKDSVVFSLVAFVLLLIQVSSQSFYGRMETLWGQLAYGTVLALIAFFLLAFQFYFAIRNETRSGSWAALMETFRFFWRHPVFCLFAAAANLVFFAMSSFILFLVPGIFGALLFFQIGLRQCLKRDAWMAENPLASRTKINWKRVFAEDQERLGSRTFKNMFQPWKQ